MTTTKLAAASATRSQVLALASILEQQREASAVNDVDQFHKTDEAFHAKIAEISGFPGIWRLVLQVKTQVDRFRRLTLTMPRRMLVVESDHESILEAISRKDPEAAAAAMERHLDAVLPALEVEEVRQRYGEHNFC
jgi:GntR family transcriptional regulator, rspAB operon transcriptional repressor